MMDKNRLLINDEYNKKVSVLKNAGIVVKSHSYGYKTYYSIIDCNMPNADKFIDTTFQSITDIVLAFSDRLRRNGIKVVA